MPLTAKDRKDSLRHGEMTEIAVKLGVGTQAVSLVVKGQSKSRRIAKAVARKIGVPLHEAFPEYARRAA